MNDYHYLVLKLRPEQRAKLLHDFYSVCECDNNLIIAEMGLMLMIVRFLNVVEDLFITLVKKCRSHQYLEIQQKQTLHQIGMSHGH